ncbi:TraB/GumN family protein [Devosia salina]|uniref:TraB/GumN family protein n=1 Tax=Devosia salina TaxID=2860336 RepID=A0ABX8WKF7_9HYPH|nr:TraB/GumN family protein [Devosia salina]QYO78249.1 TraB/GumN family protein [Devosia salina]
MKSRLALGALAWTLSAIACMAAPALWQVRDADSSVWLFGSVHLLSPETNWRSTTLDKAIDKADRVYFETDLSAEAQVRITALTFEVGFNKDGQLLSDVIGPELTDRVREAAESYGIPMAALLTMRPWMAAMTLSSGPMLDSGYEAALGVEAVISAQVPGGRQAYLETPEQQLDFLAGGSLEEQIGMLEATLDTLGAMQTDLDALVNAWAAGQPEELGALFTEQMGDFDQGMVDRLIDLRNANWVDQIDAMLERNENALIVVGAAHLTGTSSVVRLLETRGYISNRVQ